MKFKNILTKFSHIYISRIYPSVPIHLLCFSFGCIVGFDYLFGRNEKETADTKRLPTFISSAFRTPSAPQVHLSFFRTGSCHEMGLSDGSTSISLTTFLVLG